MRVGGYQPLVTPQITPAVKWLLIITVAAFVVQLVGDQASGGLFTLYCGLSRWGLARFFWWQLVTYALLHGGAFHILINMLGLFFLGPETERALGTGRFVKLYLASAVIGGLGWLLLSRGGVCIGASGALFGIIGAFAALFPHRLITLFILLVIPVTMPAWMLAVGLAVVELIYLLA
ncbi:MAG TPA: rhomboid family intramembrane serine protease, partial [Lentisphaerae bacterium]|nr:rhomboid family intramembrane serine protease [Lentisphaerota bacterium]